MSEQVYVPRRKWEYKRSELSTRQRREARAFRFGAFRQKQCWICRIALDPRQLHLAYSIHHLMPLGVEGCNALPNIVLAHTGCNAKRGKAQKAPQKSDKDRIPLDPTTALRNLVDYSTGSREMQANNEAEPVFIAKMWEFLLENRRITKARAIDGMAWLLGVSKQATRDYLDKAKSEDGPFEEFKENGIKYVRIRIGRLT